MGGEAGKEKILSRYKVVRHDLGGRGFSGDNFLWRVRNDEGGCHSARLGESDAEWIVNVWVKSAPCNPGTSTLLRVCSALLHLQTLGRPGLQGHSSIPRPPPFRRLRRRHFHWGQRKSWALLKELCIFAFSGGFKGERVRNSQRRTSGTLYVSESLKGKSSSMRGGLWGGRGLWKSSLLPTKLDEGTGIDWVINASKPVIIQHRGQPGSLSACFEVSESTRQYLLQGLSTTLNHAEL